MNDNEWRHERSAATDEFERIMDSARRVSPSDFMWLLIILGCFSLAVGALIALLVNFLL